MEKGEFAQAVKLLEQLHRSRPSHPGIALKAGYAHYELKNFLVAKRFFELSVRLRPNWETASKGLFFTLLDSGNRDEAIDEMRRYLGVHDSKDYRRIAADLDVKIDSED